MAFDDDAMDVSGYLLRTVLQEVQGIEGITEDQLKSKIIARLLWHYSVLNLFLVDNDLGGDFSEWLTERQADGLSNQSGD